MSVVTGDTVKIDSKRYSFYLQKNNSLFKGNCLVICYQATEDEIRQYNLTSNHIVLLIRSQFLDTIELDECSYAELLNSLFKNEEILIRIQCECLLGIFGDSHCDCESQRLMAIDLIAENGGIYVHMPQEAQGHGLHYKLKELELQVSGKNQKGEFVGVKNRDEAQEYILGNQGFLDNRSYVIIHRILNELGLSDACFAMISNSKSKIKDFADMGLNVKSYEDRMASDIHKENLSEYLIKIDNKGHSYSTEELQEIIDVVKTRNLTQRSISTFLSIINKINSKKAPWLSDEHQKLLSEAYDYIFCGKEIAYKLLDEEKSRKLNKFSCRINMKVATALCKIYKTNIFSRIAQEKIYFFKHKTKMEEVKIRKSKVLARKDNNELLLVGQTYLKCIKISNDTEVIENEASQYYLNSFFENRSYDFVKELETITFISENVIDGVSLYIKRIPNRDNRVLDIYGPKEKIKEMILKLSSYEEGLILSMISDVKMEEENFSKYNYRFSDTDFSAEQELELYNLINKENFSEEISCGS